MGENLAWLIQRTKEKKVIKETLLFPHIKKMWSNPSLFRFLPPFLAKNVAPSLPPPLPTDPIFGRSYPLLLNGEGGGGVPTMSDHWKSIKALFLKIKIAGNDAKETKRWAEVLEKDFTSYKISYKSLGKRK